MQLYFTLDTQHDVQILSVHYLVLAACPLPVTDRQKTRTNSYYEVTDRQNFDQQLIQGNGQTEFGLTSHSVVLMKKSSKKCQKAFSMVKIDP